MKLGLNDPCWCGSGKKYKKCHLDREKQPPARPWEVDAHIRARSKSGECLHVGTTAETICGKPAIGSHTVSRSMLKRIARNGHVYRHSATMQDLVKTDGQLTTKLIGVNDASTLRIFCQPHDSDAFAPLEQAPFTGNQEQCFLLAYRALCHEYFKKAGVSGSIPDMKGFDRGKPVVQQLQIQATMDALGGSYDVSMRDMNAHKEQYDAMLAAHDYSGMRAYVVTFENTPDILCAGALYPECDFAGRTLQSLADLAQKMELITFSLIATDSGGAFVLAWHNSGDAVCRSLAASLDSLSDDELPHAIVRFIFEFCENHYLNPDWWDAADHKNREALTARLRAPRPAWLTTAFAPFRGRLPGGPGHSPHTIDGDKITNTRGCKRRRKRVAYEGRRLAGAIDGWSCRPHRD
jgi:hypothetical protein